MQTRFLHLLGNVFSGLSLEQAACLYLLLFIVASHSMMAQYINTHLYLRGGCYFLCI